MFRVEEEEIKAKAMGKGREMRNRVRMEGMKSAAGRFKGLFV